MIVDLNPRMLVAAREAEGLTQLSLAAKLGVSQAYLSQVEHGFKSPTEHMILRLAEILNRPPRFFSDESRLLGDGLVDFFHKKRQTLPAKPLRRAHALVNICRVEVDHLLRGVDLVSTTTLPNLSLDRHASPEAAAAILRSTWRAASGPLEHLVAHVESMGLPVIVADLGHRKLSAISVPLETGGHLIVVNEMLSPSDRRFAVAHEVAHIAMHGTVVDIGDIEREADAFAGSLLMPSEHIRPELRRLEFARLGTLKQRWQVPMKAIVYRAKELGAIDADRATMLYKQLSVLQAGRSAEPGESAPEAPRLIRHVLEHLRDQLSYSYEQLADVMRTTEARLRTFYLGEHARPQLRAVPGNRPRIALD
jgi:Zn-dependent peptidase ImmA (M78 family)/transcriptional regulator with XRE-family HTH domain